MRTILDFKKAALQHNVCDYYYGKWNKATSQKDLMDVALSIQGIEFISQSVKEGWGMTSDYLASHFKDYINGLYIHHDENGYTSEMLVENLEEFTVRTTNIILINCQCVINVRHGWLCNIYVCGEQSNVAVFNEGYCNIVNYTNTQVLANGNGHSHFKNA